MSTAQRPLPECLSAVREHIRARAHDYVAALRDLVEIPSVTTDLEACQTCAQVLAGIAREAGLAPRLDTGLTTSPVVFCCVRPAQPAPILIGYAHYDVKPAGERQSWQFDPWGAVIHDGRMYGRGVVDNKSGCLALVFAADACARTTGIPVDLRLVLEGEEETGSAHLEGWALAHRKDFEGAAGLFCLDGSVEASTGLPRIDLFGRGLLYVELTVDTSDADAHSARAVLAHNAAWRLIEALMTIKDPRTDRVIIPGWADGVIDLTDDDRAYFREKAAALDVDRVRRQYGQRLEGFPGGREGEDLLRAYYMEPTCTICGFWSGHTDPSVVMTIVPSKATAKLDFRCPPNLDTRVQASKLRDHLDRLGYRDVTMKVLTPTGHPWHTSHRALVVQAIQQAGRDVFGRDRVDARGVPTQEGVFSMNFGIPPVLTGFANPDCRMHAPDENLVLDHYIRGIEYAAAIFHRFAEKMAHADESAAVSL
jgi:acetylornithine deacetylase/succinyl-diaminopimelate desuccinylase-like protein